MILNMPNAKHFTTDYHDPVSIYFYVDTSIPPLALDIFYPKIVIIYFVILLAIMSSLNILIKKLLKM